jgi:hypothetical protein
MGDVRGMGKGMGQVKNRISFVCGLAMIQIYVFYQRGRLVHVGARKADNRLELC